jgi:hypothetical protein
MTTDSYKVGAYKAPVFTKGITGIVIHDMSIGNFDKLLLCISKLRSESVITVPGRQARKEIYYFPPSMNGAQRCIRWILQHT